MLICLAGKKKKQQTNIGIFTNNYRIFGREIKIHISGLKKIRLRNRDEPFNEAF